MDALKNLSFILNITHKILSFIIFTRSHVEFLFLGKILSNSRGEWTTQHWLIYQDSNSGCAVSQSVLMSYMLKIFTV